jgi:hypothetical protein
MAYPTSRALAFTRNPSDTDVSPATYTADGASDLVLVDQQRDIAIDGSDQDDSITVSAVALASSALYNFDVRAFEGDDTINISAALVQDSVFNGNLGDDTINVYDAILTGSYVLGGKDNDDIFVDGVTGGEVNGNLGNDTIEIAAFGENVNASIRGGQGNDIIDIFGNLTNSAVYGDKGADIIRVGGGDFSGAAVYGGEDNDIITNDNGDNIQLWGNEGNDVIRDSNIGAKGVTIDGGEGNDEILTISALGATSTVDAGVGADEVAMISATGVFSAGVETYVFESGDSVAATATTIAGGRLAAGDTITFADGVDLLLGLGSEDFIDIDFNPSSVTTIGPVAPATEGDSRFEPLTPGAIYEVYGDYDLGTQVFTVEAEVAGTDQDHLYIIGAANDTVQDVFKASTNIFISNEDLDIKQFI